MTEPLDDTAHFSMHPQTQQTQTQTQLTQTLPHLPPPQFQQPPQRQDNGQPGSVKKSASAGKGKGAVRAKSGCYTCRIRRKKCDERPDEHGRCETCVRLRLQCLGFGSKRPEWMRENNSVIELRERIKTFLASQGMIKGYSGTRQGENDPNILVLATPDDLSGPPTAGTSAASSPPTPTLSASPTDRYTGMMTSSVRGDPHPPSNNNHNMYGPGSAAPRDPLFTSLSIPQYSSSSHFAQPLPGPQSAGSHHSLSPDSPLSTTNIRNGGPVNNPATSPSTATSTNGSSIHGLGGPASANGINVLSAFSPQPPPMLSPELNGNMQALVTTHWPNTSGIDPTNFVTPSYASDFPALSSSFSPLYHANFPDPDDMLDSPESAMHIYSPLRVNIPHIPDAQTELVSHYMTSVVGIQFLLAGKSISRLVLQLAQNSDTARNAVCLLSSLHRQCLRTQSAAQIGRNLIEHGESDDEVSHFYEQIEKALISKDRRYDEGDAMAGLHVVSSFLFSGGRGAWRQYLNVACDWVDAKLNSPAYSGPQEALLRATDTERFLIRTTFWFDVLASVTHTQLPRFLDIYRNLFGRNRSNSASIEDPSSPEGVASRPDCSMLTIMGANNSVVLAMAEISGLAWWKEEQKRRGTLSIPQLVRRGKDIESRLLNASTIDDDEAAISQPATANSISPDGDLDDPPSEEIKTGRKLTSEVFRASAGVYLHSVLSNDYPGIPEIVSGVQQTIRALARVPPNLERTVVRSVVLSICICGCLTDDPRQRTFLLQKLEEQQAEGVGNCSSVQELMQSVWEMREKNGGVAVPWRLQMREYDTDRALLLV